MEVQKKVKAGWIQLKNVPKHVLVCQPCSLLELTIMEQIDANQKTKAANVYAKPVQEMMELVTWSITKVIVSTNLEHPVSIKFDLQLVSIKILYTVYICT